MLPCFSSENGGCITARMLTFVRVGNKLNNIKLATNTHTHDLLYRFISIIVSKLTSITIKCDYLQESMNLLYFWW